PRSPALPHRTTNTYRAKSAMGSGLPADVVVGGEGLPVLVMQDEAVVLVVPAVAGGAAAAALPLACEADAGESSAAAHSPASFGCCTAAGSVSARTAAR